MRARVGVAAIALAGAWLCAGCGGGPTAPEPPPPLPPGAIAEVEPNDPTPQSIGVLDTADVVIGGVAAGRTDVDYYTVVLGTGGSIYTSLSWTGPPDLEVGVANTLGIMIHNQDSPGANPEVCTVTGLGPGTYRVRVGTRTAANTSYLLTIGRR
jgi:hypothetical protein